MNEDLPVGGSTGLDHESTVSIDEAAKWLATTSDTARPSPIVPHLQRRFGLSVRDACIAAREAALVRARAM